MSFRYNRFASLGATLCFGCAGAAPAPAPAPDAPRPAAATAERPIQPATAPAPVVQRPAPAPDRSPPAPTSAAVRGATLDEALERFLALENARGGAAEHVTERIDLNGDRRDDALVLLRSRRYCGARGCLLLVFERVADGYRLNSRLLLGRTPMIATDARTGGWRDLVAPMTTPRAGMRLVVLKHTTGAYPADTERLAIVPPSRAVNGRVLFSED